MCKCIINHTLLKSHRKRKNGNLLKGRKSLQEPFLPTPLLGLTVQGVEKIPAVKKKVDPRDREDSEFMHSTENISRPKAWMATILQRHQNCEKYSWLLNESLIIIIMVIENPLQKWKLDNRT